MTSDNGEPTGGPYARADWARATVHVGEDRLEQICEGTAVAVAAFLRSSADLMDPPRSALRAHLPVWRGI
jgi:hypothetical protein